MFKRRKKPKLEHHHIGVRIRFMTADGLGGEAWSPPIYCEGTGDYSTYTFPDETFPNGIRVSVTGTPCLIADEGLWMRPDSHPGVNDG